MCVQLEPVLERARITTLDCRRGANVLNGRNLRGAELRVTEAAERQTDARAFGALEHRPFPPKATGG